MAKRVKPTNRAKSPGQAKQGMVAGVEMRWTKNGDPMLVLTVGREKIYFFDYVDVAQKVAIGDTVTFAQTRRGVFLNGKGLAIAISPPHPPPAFYYRERWIPMPGKVTYRGSEFKVEYHSKIKLNLARKHIADISEIEGLENLTDLEDLNLERNDITNIAGLEHLTNLQSLGLSHNRITQIAGLENLTNLRYLYLEGNNITQIAGLDTLVNLESLTLNSNQISKIEGLAQLKKLQSISLSHNKITKIEGLETLSDLVMVNLQFNPEVVWPSCFKKDWKTTAFHLHKRGFIKGRYRSELVPPEIYDPGTCG